MGLFSSEEIIIKLIIMKNPMLLKIRLKALKIRKILGVRLALVDQKKTKAMYPEADIYSLIDKIIMLPRPKKKISSKSIPLKFSFILKRPEFEIFEKYIRMPE